MQGGGRGGVAAVVAAQEVLAGEVSGLVTGEDWQRFLWLRSRLHGYSFGSLLLIRAAHRAAFAEGGVAASEPSMVAGFRAWQGLGRHVKRGQRGYRILAPCRLSARADPDARVGPAADEAGTGPAGERRVVGFGVVHVFDVSQTDGARLPEPPAPVLLVGAAPVGLWDRVSCLVEGAGFRVVTAPDAAALGGANGVTDWAARRVLVRADMDGAARCKTLLHTGHVLLHGDEPGRGLPRSLKEVEAESVAFVVGSVCGLSTDAYSFPYVSAWAGKDPAAVLAATASRARGAAERTVAELGDLVSPAEGMSRRPPASPAPMPSAGAALETVEVVEGIGW